MPRITYNSVNIDLNIGPAALDRRWIQKRFDTQALNGKMRFTSLGGYELMEFESYFDADVYRELMAWWAWARHGREWAFAMDSAAAASTTLDGTASSGQKVIPVTSTSGFSVGDFCLIRATDNDDEFEMIEINSISAGVSVTAVENLIYSYSADDFFRHWDYWPAVVTQDDEFHPDRSGSIYKNTFKFIEVKD